MAPWPLGPSTPAASFDFQYGLLRKDAAFCANSLMAAVQAVPVCWWVAVEYMHVPGGDPFALAGAPHTSWQSFVVGVQLGFTLVDCVYLALNWEGDTLYALHHVFVLLYEGSVVWIGRGAWSVLLFMFFGEITSPVQQVWFISRRLKKGRPGAERVFNVMSPIYTVLYLLVRSVVGPPILGYMTYKAWQDHELPLLVRVIWLVCFVTGYLGSQAWSLMLARGFWKHLGKRRTAASAAKAEAGDGQGAAEPPPQGSSDGSGRGAAAAAGSSDGGATRRRRKVRVE